MPGHVTEQAAGGPLHALIPFEQKWDLSFAPNGSGAIDQSTIEGPSNVSVAWVSLGTYRVTVPKRFNALVNATATVQLAVFADIAAQIGPVDLTNHTVDIRTYDTSAGTLIDVAANAGNRINVSLTLRASDRKRF